MSNNLILFIILFSCSLAFAGEQETLENLSQDPKWTQLLHYNHPWIGKPKSDIVSPGFFLSQKGMINPLEELRATVEGLRTSADIYCKYPARRLWLESRGFRFDSIECKKFDEWTKSNGVKSISLIWATGFLGNPASYFGHPLLKFNFKDERSPLDLLDTAINYGAFTPPNVGGLPYAFFGIFGGYQAGFTAADFFFHKNNYSELELRDLWEYELDLGPQQVNMLVAHLWEMTSARIPYYFFDDNCAYRMSELLELVIDKKLVSKKAPYAIPATVFHQIYDHGLVKDIKHLGSRQTRLTSKVKSLNHSERKALGLISSDVEELGDREYLKLSEKEKSRVLETASEYYSFRMVLDKEDASLKPAKMKILQERLSLPRGTSDWQELTLTPPHKAQKPVLTNVGYFYSEKFKESASFRFRPAFYDLVSPDSGRPKLSSLSVLDISLNVNKDKLWLNSFNLISVETLNISSTGLRGDGGFAWRFKAGADQQNLACNDCLVPRFEAGIGKAWQLSDSFVIYGMIDPRLQSQYKGSGFVAITPSLSTLVTLSDDFRLNAVAGRRFSIDDKTTGENMYSIEGRFGSSRSWDLRVNFQEHVDRRYGVGFGYYW